MRLIGLCQHFVTIDELPKGSKKWLSRLRPRSVDPEEALWALISFLLLPSPPPLSLMLRSLSVGGISLWGRKRWSGRRPGGSRRRRGRGRRGRSELNIRYGIVGANAEDTQKQRGPNCSGIIKSEEKNRFCVETKHYLMLWGVTLWQLRKSSPLENGAQHRKYAKPAYWGLVLTTLTGVLFYWMAFVA